MSFYCQAVAARVTSAMTVGTTINVDFSFGGESPKACVVWAVGLGTALATDDAAAAAVSLSRGVATSTTARFCASWQSTEGGATSAVASDHRADSVLCQITADAVVGRLDLNAFSADRVQLIVDAQFTANTIFIVQAWAGTEITNATCFSSIIPIVTGVENITIPGFPVKWFDVMSIGLSGGIPQASATQWRCIIGNGFPDTAEGFVTVSRIDDGQATTNTASYYSDSECFAVMTSTGTVGGRFVVTASHPSGWTWDQVEVQGSGVRYIALALGGTFQVSKGFFDVPFPVDSSQAIEPGFSVVSGGLTFSCGRLFSAADTPSADAELSLGGFNRPQTAPVALAQGFHDYDNVLCSIASPELFVRKADVFAHLSAGAVVAGAVGPDVIADVPTRFHLVENVAEAGAVNFSYAVFGPAEPLAAGGPDDLILTDSASGFGLRIRSADLWL